MYPDICEMIRSVVDASTTVELAESHVACNSLVCVDDDLHMTQPSSPDYTVFVVFLSFLYLVGLFLWGGIPNTTPKVFNSDRVFRHLKDT